MRTIKLFLCLILSTCTFGLSRGFAQTYYRAQIASIFDEGKPREKQSLSLDFIGEGFFRNNEYSGEITRDYSLPGYRALGFFTYSPATKQPIKLKLGVENMYYWGASKYPAGLAYRDLAYWSSEGEDYSKFRLRPYFQASIVLNKKWAIILGALDGGAKHQIIEPIYNPELNLSADSETGAEIRYESPRTKADIWVDWQSFIFNDDKHQEAFFVGLDLERRFAEKKTSHWNASLQALTGHRGGKTNIVADTVHTWANLALGLSYQQELQLLQRACQLKSSLYGLTYMQRGEHYKVSEGWGIYLKNELQVQHLKANLNLWYGHNFLSILGSPFAQTIRSDGELINEDGHSAYIQAKVSYNFIEQKDYSFGLSGALWCNPLLKAKFSSYIELYLSISPHIKLF